jgi:hypothetical protein
MIVLQPVLEVYAATGYTLWPITEPGQPYGFMPLGGELSAAEVGTAFMRIAECNNVEPEADSRPRKPAGPLASFLPGCSPWTTS